LARAGLLNEVESDLKNDELLKHIYENKFVPKYALNFINLVDRPTKDMTELKKGEEKAGIKRTLKTIQTHKPKAVCFIGNVTLNIFRGSRVNDSCYRISHWACRRHCFRTVDKTLVTKQRLKSGSVKPESAIRFWKTRQKVANGLFPSPTAF